MGSLQNLSAAGESYAPERSFLHMFSRKQKFPFGKVAAGFGIGAFSGAVIALLYAPLTGKKMQKKIAAVTENLIEKVEEKVEDVQATVRRIAHA
jgi:hypothetical protein